MKRAVIFAAVALLVAGFAWINVSGARGPYAKYPSTFANSRRDTITYNRDAALAGLAFAIRTKDSMSISEIYVRRLIGGEFSTDSTRLVGAVSNTAAGFAGTAANPSYAAIYSIAVATQYCDAFAVIVVYAGSGNGVTNPVVDYYFQQQQYER